MVVEEVVVEDNKMTMVTAPMGSNHIRNKVRDKDHHPSLKDKQQHLLAEKTLTPPVSLLNYSVVARTKTHADGGYANYVSLWYQALAAQGGDPSGKPPGTA